MKNGSREKWRSLQHLRIPIVLLKDWEKIKWISRGLAADQNRIGSGLEMDALGVDWKQHWNWIKIRFEVD